MVASDNNISSGAFRSMAVLGKENSQPLVSAVITTHNRKELLVRAVEGALAQTWPHMEIIVVDDASTDGTDSYCRTQPVQYIYIPKEESQGGNYARNLGIKAARGEYVAFCDDDDYWLPEKIEKQVSLIQRVDCEMVHCGKRHEIITTDGVKYKDILPNPDHFGDMSRKILLTICTTTTNILVRRQALFEVGLFDENLRFWQEYELTIRLAQREPFYFVNEPLSVYRVDRRDPERLTNKYFEWREAVRYIHKKHKELYAQLNAIERIKVVSLIVIDAANRCQSARLKGRYFLFRILRFALLIPHRVKVLIRILTRKDSFKNHGYEIPWGGVISDKWPTDALRLAEEAGCAA